MGDTLAAKTPEQLPFSPTIEKILNGRLPVSSGTP